MTILEQRGLFWWHDEPLGADVLAPDSRVAGLCRIEDDGRSILELDGCLRHPDGAAAVMAQGPVEKCIQGLLKGSNEWILLSDLDRRGGQFRTSGISFERFVAMNCLVSHTIFPSGTKAPEFDSLQIPLSGFEKWLRFGAIKVSHTDGNISTIYERPGDQAYECGDGSLSIIHDVDEDSSGMLGTYAFSLKEWALLRLRLNSAWPLRDLQMQYRMIEDLTMLLTDSDYGLDWPQVSLNDGSKYRWYFTRMKRKEAIAAPDYHDTITNFRELRDQFGEIWSNWKAKREQFGPGFYLYIGTRRGLALYAENRFMNLIWGLEAFHRNKGEPVESDTLAKKKKRIIEQVADANDKKWLTKMLKNAHEPPLSKRLFEVFRALPIGLDEAKLRAFSETCSKQRNEISHFGGQQDAKPYSDFILDLERKSATLSTLYHALLLHEIGIDAAILRRWLYEGFGSFAIKANFVEAGLLDPCVLRNNDPVRDDDGSEPK